MRVLVACEYSGRVRDAEVDAVPIVGFTGYLITRCGVVLSKKARLKERPYYRALRPVSDKKGYLGLTLCDGPNVRKKVRIHRLVAEHFITNPEGKPCVRHLDGNPKNNSAENLAWGTYAENEADKSLHGTYETRRNGKLSERDRQKIKSEFALGVSQKNLAAKFGVSRPTITRLINGSTWL